MDAQACIEKKKGGIFLLGDLCGAYWSKPIVGLWASMKVIAKTNEKVKIKEDQLGWPDLWVWLKTKSVKRSCWASLGVDPKNRKKNKKGIGRRPCGPVLSLEAWAEIKRSKIREKKRMAFGPIFLGRK